MTEPELPLDDLESIVESTAPLWNQLCGQRIFLTGGTGFFGRWLIESFLYANRRFDLQAEAVVLSRDPAAFIARVPHLAQQKGLGWIQGDMRDFDFPDGTFSHVIHAATEVARVTPGGDPLERLRSIERGTERVLQFAAQCNVQKFLLVSSGAAYGDQPAHISHVPETHRGAPSTLDGNSSYGEGKRLSELMCTLYAAQFPIEMKIARCFAFVGPALPLDAGFAIGNFIADAEAGRAIHIGGDGTPTRSYLYAADLAVWLWTILFDAPALQIFNVGSEHAISVKDLASAVAKALHADVPVLIAKEPTEGMAPRQYVPHTGRAQHMLRLRETVPLAESIRRTAAWNRLR